MLSKVQVLQTYLLLLSITAVVILTAVRLVSSLVSQSEGSPHPGPTLGPPPALCSEAAGVWHPL